MNKSNLLDLTIFFVAETEKAYGIKELEDDKTIIWCAKSQCEMDGEKGSVATITMPEWLALEKGFI